MLKNSDSYSVFSPSGFTAEERPGASYMVIVPLYVALIAGTGGGYAASNIQLANQFVSHPIVSVVDSRGSRESQSRFSSQVLRIREVFGLNMSELASVFGVARPTAYAWIQGAEPRADLIDKIWMLSSWADDFEQIGISRMSTYLRRPLVENRSLLNLLTSGEDLGAAVIKTKELALLDKQTESRMRSATRRMNSGRSAVDISSVIGDLE